MLWTWGFECLRVVGSSTWHFASRSFLLNASFTFRHNQLDKLTSWTVAPVFFDCKTQDLDKKSRDCQDREKSVELFSSVFIPIVRFLEKLKNTVWLIFIKCLFPDFTLTEIPVVMTWLTNTNREHVWFMLWSDPPQLLAKIEHADYTPPRFYTFLHLRPPNRHLKIMWSLTKLKFFKLSISLKTYHFQKFDESRIVDIPIQKKFVPQLALLSTSTFPNGPFPKILFCHWEFESPNCRYTLQNVEFYLLKI